MNLKTHLPALMDDVSNASSGADTPYWDNLPDSILNRQSPPNTASSFASFRDDEEIVQDGDPGSGRLHKKRDASKRKS